MWEKKLLRYWNNKEEITPKRGREEGVLGAMYQKHLKERNRGYQQTAQERGENERPEDCRPLRHCQEAFNGGGGEGAHSFYWRGKKRGKFRSKCRVLLHQRGGGKKSPLTLACKKEERGQERNWRLEDFRSRKVTEGRFGKEKEKGGRITLS